MVHLLARWDDFQHHDRSVIVRYVCALNGNWFWGSPEDLTTEAVTCLACVAEEGSK